MPLNKEILKANPVLSTLTDDQLAIIETLSKNEQAETISGVLRDVHNQYDRDITSITGIEKPHGAKTYDFLKNVLTDFKTRVNGVGDATELQTKVKQLETREAELLKQIQSGNGGAELKNQLTQLQQTLKDKESELETVKTTLSSEAENLKSQLEQQQKEALNLRLNQEFDSYVQQNGLKFKSGMPGDILSEVLTNRKNALLSSLKTDFIDDGTGNKTLVFRNDAGEIMRNRENGLNPYTPGELYKSKIADLLEETAPTGGGTQPATRTTNGKLDLSGARTRVEADGIISDYLTSVEGIAKTNPAYAERRNELRQENNVSELPTR